MKIIISLIVLALLSGCATSPQNDPPAGTIENLILVTSDGLRWQEVFGGLDSSLASDNRFNEGDSSYMMNKYGGSTARERRQRLMPFLWSAIASQGQLYGNRWLGNKVDNANPYWFSYPGYSELLTGYADTAINSNDYPANPHLTLPEFFNQQKGWEGRVAAFGAWQAFDRIINEKRSGIPVVCALDTFGGKQPTAAEQLLNRLHQDAYKPWHDHECFDVFTHYGAQEYLHTRKPRLLYIAYGETDEWAHAGRYRSYLDAAHQVDKWISDIWNYVQSDPQYRDKTAIFITTDHGRGDTVKTQWTSHGSSIAGASQIWFAVLAPGITTTGEMKGGTPLYQQQLAQTMAGLLGYTYSAQHPIAPGISLINNEK